MWAADAPPAVERCVDLVIHGRLEEQVEGEGVGGPDDLVGHSRWRLTFRVDRVVLGSWKDERLEADSIQHVGLNQDYGRTFMFRRSTVGPYLVAISPRRLWDDWALTKLAERAGAELCD